MTRIRFWPEGARTMGRCEGNVDRGDCLGVMMVVENMGLWTWAQCSVCLTQSGIRKGGDVPAGAVPLAPAKTGDPFLDNS